MYRRGAITWDILANVAIARNRFPIPVCHFCLVACPWVGLSFFIWYSRGPPAARREGRRKSGGHPRTPVHGTASPGTPCFGPQKGARMGRRSRSLSSGGFLGGWILHPTKVYWGTPPTPRQGARPLATPPRKRPKKPIPVRVPRPRPWDCVPRHPLLRTAPRFPPFPLFWYYTGRNILRRCCLWTSLGSYGCPRPTILWDAPATAHATLLSMEQLDIRARRRSESIFSASMWQPTIRSDAMA